MDRLHNVRTEAESTEADSDIPVHVRVHVHEGKISGRGLSTKAWSGCGHKMEAAKSSAKLVELCLHWQFSYSNLW